MGEAITVDGLLPDLLNGALFTRLNMGDVQPTPNSRSVPNLERLEPLRGPISSLEWVAQSCVIRWVHGSVATGGR